MRYNRGLLKSGAVCLLVIIVVSLTYSIRAQNSPETFHLTWSPDGRQIAGVTNNGIIRIWDAASSRILLDLSSPARAVDSITWSPDGTRIASVSSKEGLIRIWNTTNGELTAQLQGDRTKEGPSLIAWSPDGTKLVSVAFGEVYPLRFWDVKGDNFQPLPISADVSAYNIAWSPDSSKLAVADYRGLYIFSDFSSSALKGRSIAPFVVPLAWGPDSNKIAGGDTNGTIHIWNANTGREEAMLSVFKGKSSDVNVVGSIVWDSDGKRIASAGPDPTIRIWDTGTGNKLAEYPNIHNVRSLAWSPYGGRLAFSDDNGLQFVVPTPSLTKLQAIIKACAKADIQPRLVSQAEKARLPDFVTEVKKLTEDQIPPACAADLIAVVEALQKQP